MLFCFDSGTIESIYSRVVLRRQLCTVPVRYFQIPVSESTFDERSLLALSTCIFIEAELLLLFLAKELDEFCYYYKNC